MAASNPLTAGRNRPHLDMHSLHLHLRSAFMEGFRARASIASFHRLSEPTAHSGMLEYDQFVHGIDKALRYGVWSAVTATASLFSVASESGALRRVSALLQRRGLRFTLPITTRRLYTVLDRNGDAVVDESEYQAVWRAPVHVGFRVLAGDNTTISMASALPVVNEIAGTFTSLPCWHAR